MTWILSEDNEVANGIDKIVINYFDDLGLDQLITDQWNTEHTNSLIHLLLLKEGQISERS